MYKHAKKNEDPYEGEALFLSSLREKYLGDVISVDGKNDTHINSKINNGIGLVNKISALLVEIMAGKEHFEMGTLLRNICLVSSLIFNCES